MRLYTSFASQLITYLTSQNVAAFFLLSQWYKFARDMYCFWHLAKRFSLPECFSYIFFPPHLARCKSHDPGEIQLLIKMGLMGSVTCWSHGGILLQVCTTRAVAFPLFCSLALWLHLSLGKLTERDYLLVNSPPSWPKQRAYKLTFTSCSHETKEHTAETMKWNIKHDLT